MIIAHKIALDLNNQQMTYCQQAAGTARFAYNWALAEWNNQYHAWTLDHNTLTQPSEAALRRQLNAIKHQQFPWMLKVSKTARQMAIIQLGKAFKNFFAGRAKLIFACSFANFSWAWTRFCEPLTFRLSARERCLSF